MANEQVSPELLVKIQDKLDELEVVAAKFHEAQGHVNEVIENLLSNEQ